MAERPTWEEYFMLQAKVAALRSTCNSRPTGCVLVKDNVVVATGYNGAVKDMPHCTDLNCLSSVGPYCQRRDRGSKDGVKDRDCVAAHAEANAIAFAARRGVAVEGAVAYCTLSPCPVCMKLLYQAGIVKVFYELGYDDGPTLGLIEMERVGLSSPTKWAAGQAVAEPSSYRRLPKTR